MLAGQSIPGGPRSPAGRRELERGGRGVLCLVLPGSCTDCGDCGMVHVQVSPGRVSPVRAEGPRGGEGQTGGAGPVAGRGRRDRGGAAGRLSVCPCDPLSLWPCVPLSL